MSTKIKKTNKQTHTYLNILFCRRESDILFFTSLVLFPPLSIYTDTLSTINFIILFFFFSKLEREGIYISICVFDLFKNYAIRTHPGRCITQNKKIDIHRFAQIQLTLIMINRKKYKALILLLFFFVIKLYPSLFFALYSRYIHLHFHSSSFFVLLSDHFSSRRMHTRTTRYTIVSVVKATKRFASPAPTFSLYYYTRSFNNYNPLVV